jgi:DNA gyrase/topoisomerase IV subunit B
MNPVTRGVKQVTLEDAAEADWLFTVLMGEGWSREESLYRNHAKAVMNLDV